MTEKTDDTLQECVEFEFEGKQYKLGFTRRTVLQMERKGFSFLDAGKMPLNSFDALYNGSFLLYHSKVSEATRNKIWKHLDNKQGLIKRLSELYKNAIYTMVDAGDNGEDKEEEEKNVIKWS